MSDSLLDRVASGDPQAVQECLDRYSGLVWSLARRLGPAEDAEDTVQEIFIEIWKSAGRFDASKASEPTFIAVIARRRLIDRLRRASSRPELAPLPDAFEVAGSDHHDIERGVEAGIAARVLAELPEEQRRVITLSVLQGLSHGDVAKVVSLPLGTVKSHVRRGLARIRERLASPLAEEGA